MYCTVFCNEMVGRGIDNFSYLEIGILFLLPKDTYYRKPSINTANGSCMFGVLFESVLIEVKNKGD